MADEFVVLEEDLYVERALPGMPGRTTRILVGRAGQRVHRSRLPQGRFASDSDGGTVDDAIASQAGQEPAGDADADGQADTPDDGTDGDSGSQEPVDGPPAGNASTAEWQRYALEVEGPDPDPEVVERITSSSRDELRDAYDPDGTSD